MAKAESLEKGENPRFVVTSLPAESWEAAALYEKTYCGRGKMENRIKEQLSLFADRMSTESMRANQLRLYFSSLAYVLVHALRRLALAGNSWREIPVSASDGRRAQSGRGQVDEWKRRTATFMWLPCDSF